MKIRSFLIAVIALLSGVSAFATNKQVTVSGTAAPVFTLLDPKTKVIFITNPSASTGTVNVSLDGTAPTSSLGVPLAPGQTMTINLLGAPNNQPNIPQVILVSGAATISVSTDTTVST